MRITSPILPSNQGAQPATGRSSTLAPDNAGTAPDFSGQRSPPARAATAADQRRPRLAEIPAVAVETGSSSGRTSGSRSPTRSDVAHLGILNTLNAARDVLNRVRMDLYKPNFKSTNKTNEKRSAAAEAHRIRRAGDELDSLHNRIYSSPSVRDEAIWQCGAHNCGELARAARHLGRQFGHEVTVVGAEAHAFAVFGRYPEEGLSSNMKEWPNHLMICDPWANIVCSANEYPERFVAKMEKWVQDKKLIYLNERWTAPNDADWITTVLEGPKPVND